MNFGGLVDHLVHGQGNEVAKHDVDYRTHSGHGRANGKSGEAGFGNWSIEDALFAEFLEQTGENFEGSSGLGYVFAENEDCAIAAHFFRQRLANGLRERKFTAGLRVGFKHTHPRPPLRRLDMALRQRSRLPSSSRTQG